MKLESTKLRFCRAIDCNRLKKGECGLEECELTDMAKALAERVEKLQREVKHGGPA